jgi:hypothetical protein
MCQAVEVEVKRNEALEELRKPIPGMSEETKALLLSSDDEDEPDQEPDNEGDSALGGSAPHGWHGCDEPHPEHKGAEER